MTSKAMLCMRTSHETHLMSLTFFSFLLFTLLTFAHLSFLSTFGFGLLFGLKTVHFVKPVLEAAREELVHPLAVADMTGEIRISLSATFASLQDHEYKND